VQATKRFGECIHKNPIIAIVPYPTNRKQKQNNKRKGIQDEYAKIMAKT